MQSCAETRRQIRTAGLIARYDANVPRYTSYPTAAQFTREIGPGEWAEWLGEVPIQDAVSIYVHIPFCRTLCWYCACNTRALNRAQTIDTYVDLLIAEAREVARRLGHRQSVRRLHLGGGTPNMLSPGTLGRLFHGLHEAFDLRAVTEVAA